MSKTAKTPRAKKAKPTLPAPSDAEVKRLVEAWAKAKGIDSPGLTISTWVNGSGDDVLDIRTEPEPPRTTTKEYRQSNGLKLSCLKARESFVEFWAEVVAVVNDLDMAFQDLRCEAVPELVKGAGIDMEKVAAIGRKVTDLSCDVSSPPYKSKAGLRAPHALTKRLWEEWEHDPDLC